MLFLVEVGVSWAGLVGCLPGLPHLAGRFYAAAGCLAARMTFLQVIAVKIGVAQFKSHPLIEAVGGFPAGAAGQVHRFCT